MITPADDLPVHQSSRPLRDPGADRNLYDRFFFNGYTRDGASYFAVALGQYPGRNITDAAFSVQHEGTQHNVRASRILGADRLDSSVGPIRVEVLEPLRRLRVTVAEAAGSGISADLTFAARGPAFEEPHFHHRTGFRTMLDYTRLTQNGSWSGWISVAGARIELTPEAAWGTRDRSWGIRPVGERDPGGAPDGPEMPQFFWLWAPLNFDDACALFDVQEYPDGTRWHEGALWAPATGADAAVTTGKATYSLRLRSGSRHAEAAAITWTLDGGAEHSVELIPVSTFYMHGIGYTHPVWGHGMWVGADEVGYDSFVLADTDDAAPQNIHVQTLVRAKRDDGAEGIGILEQLLIGPHQPLGLTGILDPAP